MKEENSFFAPFMAVDIPAFSLSVEGRNAFSYHHINGAYAAISGISAQDIADRPPLGGLGERGIPPADLIEHSQKCCEKNQGLSFEAPLRVAGVKRWWQVYLAPFGGKEGKAAGILGILTDITKAKEAQRQLKASEETYRTFFEESFDGLYMTTPEGRFLDINKKGLKILGYHSKEEVLGLSMEADVYADPQDRRPILSAINDQGADETDVVFKKKGGQKMIAHLSVTAVRDESGAVTAYRVILRDVTEQRQAEEKYRLLVTNAGEAICIVQDDFIKFSNPKAMEMTGFSVAELATIGFTDLIHPNDRGPDMDRFLDSRDGAARSKISPFRIINKSGKEMWVQLTSAPITWEGQPGLLCFLRDITEEKKLEAQFMQSQKMEAIGRLAGGVAHDFNNILSVINGVAELALLSLHEGDPIQKSFQEILRSGERAVALTRQLLVFSRKQVMALEVIDLNGLLAGTESMLKRLIGEDIELKTMLDSPLGHIRADRGQIEQIILNLAINARDAMPDGGKLTIETANVYLGDERSTLHLGARPGPHVLLAMTDNGCGMDPETMNRIFEPFFTTKVADKGTGLGLATVYGIVKQSGGSITVESEPGRGTGFKVYFPRVDEEVAEKILPMSQAQGGTGETILVVEDEEALRQVIVKILKRSKYNVIAARNGEEACMLSERYPAPIDLLLTDVIMPQMRGDTLAATLTASRRDIKVLYMSGYMDRTTVQERMTAVGAHFIQKPFSTGSLLTRIRQVLSGPHP